MNSSCTPTVILRGPLQRDLDDHLYVNCSSRALYHLSDIASDLIQQEVSSPYQSSDNTLTVMVARIALSEVSKGLERDLTSITWCTTCEWTTQISCTRDHDAVWDGHSITSFIN